MTTQISPATPRPLLRQRDVQRILAMGRTALHGNTKKGLVTPALRRGRTLLWPADEIAAINDAFIAGSSESELKDLVKKLLAARGGDTHTKPAPLAPMIKSPRRSNRALSSAP